MKLIEKHFIIRLQLDIIKYYNYYIIMASIKKLRIPDDN